MTPDEIRKLMAGYATGALTEEQRDRLFAEALKDQALFDQMAEEEALRDLLTVPGVRSELLDELAPKSSGWMWWKIGGVLAVAALVLGVGIEALRRPVVKPVDVALNAPQQAVRSAPPVVAVTPVRPSQQQAGRSVGSGAKALLPDVAEETRRDTTAADVVQRGAVADKKLQDEKKPEATIAAEAPKAEPVAPPPAVVAPQQNGARPAAPAPAPPPSATQSVTVDSAAPLLATQPGQSFAGGFGALRRQVTAPKVTDLNGTVVSIDQGTSAGWKVGDRLEILHEGRVLGTIRLTQVGATFAAGVMEGLPSEVPQKGDGVRRAPVVAAPPPP